jgi:hypothetical protein
MLLSFIQRLIFWQLLQSITYHHGMDVCISFSMIHGGLLTLAQAILKLG